jgi:hypothetical protein
MTIEVFIALLNIMAMVAVGFLGWIAISVTHLNTKIATVIERLGHHETRISRLEENQ